MQLSDILAAANDLLDEDGVRRTTAALTDTVNLGYRTVAVVTQSCEATRSWRASSNSLVSPLPADFYTAVAVYYNGTRLYPVRMADLDDLNPNWLKCTTVTGAYFDVGYFEVGYSADGTVSSYPYAGTPLYYTTTGAMTGSPMLWLYPPPDTSGTIKMTYATVPNALVYEADTPAFPREHHYVLVWWAYAWELLKERGALLANKAYQTYARFVEDATALQQYVYRRTPDRDWVSPPLDMEAVRRKMVNLEQILQKVPAGTEAQAMRQ